MTNALETAEQSNGKANDSKTESTEYYEVKEERHSQKLLKNGLFLNRPQAGK